MFKQELKNLKTDIKHMGEKIADSLKIGNERLKKIVGLKMKDMRIALQKVEKALHELMNILDCPEFDKDRKKVEELGGSLAHVMEHFTYIDISPERLWGLRKETKTDMMDWLKGPEMDLLIKLDNIAAKLEHILEKHSNSEKGEGVIKAMESIEEMRIKLRRILREVEAEYKAVSKAA